MDKLVVEKIKKWQENPALDATLKKELESLDDMLANKVLRKLESQNPVYVKNKSSELIAKLNSIFGNDKMKNSVDYINRISRNG